MTGEKEGGLSGAQVLAAGAVESCCSCLHW